MSQLVDVDRDEGATSIGAAVVGTHSAMQFELGLVGTCKLASTVAVVQVRGFYVPILAAQGLNT